MYTRQGRWIYRTSERAFAAKTAKIVSLIFINDIDCWVKHMFVQIPDLWTHFFRFFVRKCQLGFFALDLMKIDNFSASLKKNSSPFRLIFQVLSQRNWCFFFFLFEQLLLTYLLIYDEYYLFNDKWHIDFFNATKLL